MTTGGWSSLFAPRVLLESVPGGVDVRDFTDDVVDFKYSMAKKKINKATITLANIDLKYANDPRFDQEIRFRVRWGYPGGLSSTEELIATQVAPNVGAGVPQLVITALDVGSNLISLGARNWGAVSSSSIATSIARRHGLTPDIVPSNDARSEHRLQSAVTTDYEFLARLAERINYDFWVEGGTLYYKPVDTSALPRHRFVYYIDGSSTLKSFHPTVKKGKVHTRHVGGVSEEGAPSVQAPRRAPTERALGSHYVIGINGRANRAGVVERPTGDIATTPSPETNPAVRLRHASAAQHQAEMEAVHMQLELVGYPLLRIRDIIDIYVVERRYSGLWRVESCDHHISAGGYETSAKVKRAELNASPSVISGSQVPRNERNSAVANSGNSGPAFEIDTRATTISPVATIPQRTPVTAR